MNNKKYLHIIFFFLVFVSCERETNTDTLMCNYTNPLEEIDWLAEYIEVIKSNEWAAEIHYCTYNDGLQGFFVIPCMDCYNPDWYYYDCDRNLLCGTNGWPGVYCIDSFKVVNQELIWEYNPEPEN